MGNIIARAFHRWERMIDTGIEYYVKGLDFVFGTGLRLIVVAYRRAGGHHVFLWPMLRKEFFPEVDAGSFEMYVRAPSGLRIEEDGESGSRRWKIMSARSSTRKTFSSVLSELGVTSDWSAAYTPNAGTMDAVVKIQLTAERKKSAQEYVAELRQGVAGKSEFSRPGVCLRRRRHGPLGDERGQVHADQHPRDRQGPEDRPPGRLDDAERRSSGSTAWWTPGSSSDSIIRNT